MVLDGTCGQPATIWRAIDLPERTPVDLSDSAFTVIPATADQEPDTTEPNSSIDLLQAHSGTPVPWLQVRNDFAFDGRGPYVGNETGDGSGADPVPVVSDGSIQFKTYYVYSSNGLLLAEYDENKVCQREYIYQGSTLVAEYQPVSNAYFYYTSDQINSTRVVTNQVGTVVYTAYYEPFGRTRINIIKSYAPRLEFSGKDRDDVTGLDYFGARWYSSKYYRFISPDPVVGRDEALTDPQLWNAYTYCRNNPINFFDPDGRFVIGRRAPRGWKGILGLIPGISGYVNPVGSTVSGGINIVAFILDKANQLYCHEQGFFTDGSGENIGYGADGFMKKENIDEYSFDLLQVYDDDIMRIAMNDVNSWWLNEKHFETFFPYGHRGNCQSYLAALVNRYYEILEFMNELDMSRAGDALRPLIPHVSCEVTSIRPGD
jgi:RHS repeat-associated protein